jgi:hypothetical protein
MFHVQPTVVTLTLFLVLAVFLEVMGWF